MCFIHRPEYYTRSDQDAAGNDIRGLAEFIVAKHRSGSVDDIKLRFKARFARFENWDEEDNDALSSTSTVGSRLNTFDNDPIASTSALSGGDADIMRGPEDTHLRFKTFFSQ